VQTILARLSRAERYRVAPPFPQSHLGEGGRLLTGEGAFESCCGSQHGAVVYWLGFAVLSRKERDRYPPALPHAHVALLPTKQDKGNWTENAGSNPAVCSIRAKDCGSRQASDACSACSTHAALTNFADTQGASSALNRAKWVQILRPQPSCRTQTG
jgi:hypothetical protein